MTQNMSADLVDSDSSMRNTDSELSLQDKLFMLLSPFHFTNPTLLRNLMRRTGMIISGSMALALIHPNQFLPNDIDFYVLPPGFPSIVKYVEDHGYKIKPFDRTLATYFFQNIIIVKLIHPISLKIVNVMTATDNHVSKAITHFHSTIVMNYVAWFGVVVLYPEWTLEKRGLIVSDTPDSKACITKYEERGYTLHDDVVELSRPLQTHICQVDPYCPNSLRSLHDGHSLVKTFEPGLDFVIHERDMSWTLPVSCSFDNLPTAQD